MEADEGPESGRGGSGAPSEGTDSWKLYVYDLLSSVVIVALIGGLLFTASGVWPPMVAVESGSMNPEMERGDLVYVMETERFAGPDAEAGVVTAAAGEENGYERFAAPGDVIVFEPGGDSRTTPIIHRAMFWVEAGENWYDRADESAVNGDSCREIRNCPAPHAGFITKGDANRGYDQVTQGRTGPVKPEWVIGTAELYVPYLGQIRLGV
ncbi:S26 family signal peptidase [Halapricum sp. CBA1109]|uniref:S26 family signal peptidase n=1 Tax=Halapricum sp. CBA1109 TaxID=2668068 RepID=UPI0012F9B736|nr:S26 family signal peptidase [Halapricum sp. CBA1109]MUV89610.1 S26 family signal peptidase [Halapricum sp. CBA1109]